MFLINHERITLLANSCEIIHLSKLSSSSFVHINENFFATVIKILYENDIQIFKDTLIEKVVYN